MINTKWLTAELLHNRLRMDDINRQILQVQGETRQKLLLSLDSLQDAEDDILKELDLVKANEKVRNS